MTEREKMLAGKLYDISDPELVKAYEKADRLCKAYNDTYILYSLGNLVFGGNVDPDDRDACAVRMTFTVYEDRCDPPQIAIVPLRLTELSDGTDYRPVLAQGEEAERIVKRILKRSHKMDGFENGAWEDR